MFNLLDFIIKYIIAFVTLGCVIANFFSFNMIDVVVGSPSTLVFVCSGVIFDRFKTKTFWVAFLTRLMFLPFTSHSLW